VLSSLAEVAHSWDRNDCFQELDAKDMIEDFRLLFVLDLDVLDLLLLVFVFDIKEEEACINFDFDFDNDDILLLLVLLLLLLLLLLILLLIMLLLLIKPLDFDMSNRCVFSCSCPLTNKGDAKSCNSRHKQQHRVCSWRLPSFIMFLSLSIISDMAIGRLV